MADIATIETCLLHDPDPPARSSRGRATWRGATVDMHGGIDRLEMRVPPLDHFAIIYIATGHGRIVQETDGRKVEGTVRAGTAIVRPPGLGSRWSGSAPPTVRIRLPLSLFDDTFRVWLGQVPDLRRLERFNVRDPLISHVAQIYRAEMDLAPHPAQMRITESVSYALAANVVRMYDPAFATADEKSGGLEKRVLNRTIDFVDRSYREPLTLQRMADQAGLSKFHFARLFKQSFGLGAMAYVERRRLQEAALRLDRGETDVAQIARAVGFGDRAYFSKRFARRYGCSPSRYGLRRCIAD